MTVLWPTFLASLQEEAPKIVPELVRLGACSKVKPSQALSRQALAEPASLIEPQSFSAAALSTEDRGSRDNESNVCTHFLSAGLASSLLPVALLGTR